MAHRRLIVPAHGKTTEVRSGARETAYERGEEESLSQRQLQVVFLASYGIKDKEIAKMLWIGYETVCTHWRTAFLKTGTHNRAELVIKLLRDGIIS